MNLYRPAEPGTRLTPGVRQPRIERSDQKPYRSQERVFTPECVLLGYDRQVGHRDEQRPVTAESHEERARVGEPVLVRADHDPVPPERQVSAALNGWTCN